MRYFISIETATEVCSVCLHSENELIAEMHAEKAYQHTRVLTTLIDKMMVDSNIAYHQLSAIAVSSGPGSFTGLRVGIATAKGLCFGLDIPVIAISTLHSLAYGMKQQYPNRQYYIPMIDARRMEVYTQVYDGQLCAVSEVQALILSNEVFGDYLEGSTIAFGGNGSQKFKSLCSFDNITYTNIRCDAIFMMNLVAEKNGKQQFEDLSYFEPNYFKSANITKSKKNILV